MILMNKSPKAIYISYNYIAAELKFLASEQNI